MIYQSPTYGHVNEERLRTLVTAYMHADKKAQYEVIIGSDSQKIKTDTYDFVSALIIHKIGSGGIFFWQRDVVAKKMGLRERIYLEAMRSLKMSEDFVSFFQKNGIAKYDMQIHVDIGKKGDTREMITEVVAMVRGSGYTVKIKPDSFGASSVADRFT